MAANHPAIDRRKYGRLLAKTLPAVIETEEQNERMLREVERLIDKGHDNLSPEEKTLPVAGQATKLSSLAVKEIGG